MNTPTATPDLTTRAPRWLIAALTLGLFLLFDHYHLALFRHVAGDWEGYRRLAALAVLGYGANLLVPLGLGCALFGPRRALSALGLDRSPLIGLAVALAGTSILLLGLLWTLPFAPPDAPLLVALRGSVLPGVGEELFYRAFLFGFLFRFAGWGFVPAALLGALIFGAAHLYQGETLADAAAIFAITALGAVFFAWLYVEWQYNVWVPSAFHVLMNLYWELFAVSDTALGSTAANLLRFSVIPLALILTLMATRRRGGRTIRGRRWLWRDPQP